MTDSFLTISSKCSHTFTEQCSATSSLKIASALQLSKSSRCCNSKLCVICVWEYARSSIALTECYLLSACLIYNFTMLCYECKLCNRLKFWNQQVRHRANFCILLPYMLKLLTIFIWFTRELFYQILSYLMA